MYDEPVRCGGNWRNCKNPCLLGHLRDTEGCLTCKCKKSGTFEGDILVTSYYLISFLNIVVYLKKKFFFLNCLTNLSFLSSHT